MKLRGELKVRTMQSWPRSWANFSLLQLYSHRNAWANSHIVGQPDTLLAQEPWLRRGDEALQRRAHAEAAEVCCRGTWERDTIDQF